MKAFASATNYKNHIRIHTGISYLEHYCCVYIDFHITWIVVPIEQGRFLLTFIHLSHPIDCIALFQVKSHMCVQ